MKWLRRIILFWCSRVSWLWFSLLNLFKPFFADWYNIFFVPIIFLFVGLGLTLYIIIMFLYTHVFCINFLDLMLRQKLRWKLIKRLEVQMWFPQTTSTASWFKSFLIFYFIKIPQIEAYCLVDFFYSPPQIQVSDVINANILFLFLKVLFNYLTGVSLTVLNIVRLILVKVDNSLKSQNFKKMLLFHSQSVFLKNYHFWFNKLKKKNKTLF